MRQKRDSFREPRPRTRKIAVRIHGENALLAHCGQSLISIGKIRRAVFRSYSLDVVAARHHHDNFRATLRDLLSASLETKARPRAPERPPRPPSPPSPAPSARPRNMDRAIRGTEHAGASSLAPPSLLSPQPSVPAQWRVLALPAAAA